MHWACATVRSRVVSIAVGGFVVQRISRRHRSEALAWIYEGRAPDEREHRTSLELPFWQAKIAALAWFAAIPLFFAINLSESVGFATVAALTVGARRADQQRPDLPARRADPAAGDRAGPRRAAP